MLDQLASNYWVISAWILGAAFTAYLSWRHYVKTRRVRAFDMFRSEAVLLLKPFYPPPGAWDRGFESDLRQAVDTLSSQATIYSGALSERERKKFDTAWDAFASHAKRMTWDENTAFKMYPNMHDTRNPVEVFYERLRPLIASRNPHAL